MLLTTTRLVFIGILALQVEARAAPGQAHDQSSTKLPSWDQTTLSLIAKYNYTSETHTVQTADGYLLTLHRIPNPGKEVVLLQHGLLSSSADWVVLGPQDALGFLLYDAGYDVWMTNTRGNKYSLGHVKYSTNSDKYWDFSFHEMGMYDLPASIDDILSKTGKKNLTYVGHSQGTTSFFVMGSLRPEYNEKIRAMHALAPVAYLTHIKSARLKLIATQTGSIEFVNKLLGSGEFLPSSDLLSKFETYACKDGSVLQLVCTNVLFLLVGFDIKTLDTEKIPDIVANIPAGSSTKTLIHYGQLVNAAKETFMQYDEGVVGNLLKYKSISPPKYPVEKVTAPVHLHYSLNDWIGVPQCTKILSQQLPNLKVWKVSRETFNHLDFVYAKDVKPQVYDTLIQIIDGQTP